MVTDDVRNSRRFNVSFPCHVSGIFHRHARPLSLYPPVTYSQASDYSVTDGLKKTMLLIGTPLVVTCWRSFIHNWRSSWCHSWSHCDPHPPLSSVSGVSGLSKWRIRFKKYFAVRMTCAAWLIFTINDSSVSVLIFVEDNASFMSLTQDVCFYSGRNTLREWVFMYHPSNVLCSSSCPYPTSFLKEGGHFVSGVLMAVVVGIVYGWPIEPHFLRDISNVGNQLLWWWCHWWIHPSIHQWLWYPLLRCLPLQDGLLTAVLFSAGCPPPTIFLKESGLSCFRGYDGCSGWNSVWMTNRAALFARYIQCW